MIDYGARELEMSVFSSIPYVADSTWSWSRSVRRCSPMPQRGVKVTALVESVEAAQRARALGIRHVDFFLSVSDAFGQGFGSTPDRAFATLEAIANLPDLQVQAALGAVFGCPSVTPLPWRKRRAYAQRAMGLGPVPGTGELSRKGRSNPHRAHPAGNSGALPGQSKYHCTSTTLRDLVLPTV